MQILKPRRLALGDTIGIVAPSLPLLPSWREDYELGVRALRALGFGIQEGASIGPARWWSAGTPSAVAEDLNAMLRDPEIRAVAALSGGFSALSLLDLLDYDAVRHDPKPLLGYSDITLLHLALYGRCGLVGLHTDGVHEVGQLWKEAGPGRRTYLEQAYRHILTNTDPLGAVRPASAWEGWRSGSAQGVLIGGNLKRLAALIGTPYFPPIERFDGALLFWEEIGETLYDICLNLQKLRLAGVLDRISGMLIGKVVWVNEYFEEVSHPSVREAVLDVVGDRDLPILADVDFGHNTPNIPLPIGLSALVDADERRLSILEAAVR